ncbi:hypothetical protein BMW24_022130 [Mycobacterium heckeshornense]|uniref:Uncharacterized protein n=1 Tax=Mycobacterium heckeshornense TaxID=110505 RepID=A0A2G8AY94_9MYCO|nr:hypothetical protein [Mycobacterium heckeshornense]KMV22573.1 hypothetical protein ACT16_11030 [Mycobacterium heckeshornense]MCV7034674.1 hypothetical protein [Mycobacterium heckeshornense]PIJ30490.1 hypothetical protein BMW24_022130 [Mycobacterium heckeshornense]BCO33927.1 hypothetical protein MHEC_03600 [Mycobacterium heckeshornense]
MNHALAGVDLLIGIDDTDNLRSPGTGRRARALLCELATAGLGTPAGATRHQLLLDDQIPYTTHNSSACLAWRSRDGNPEQVKRDVIAVAARFLERVCPPDADPGLAVAVPGRLTHAVSQVIDFGRRAKREVLHANEARELAATLGVHLSGHGGTQDGVLGALAAVGLHLSGDDGLFITLPGLEQLPREATVDQLRARVSIDEVRDSQDRRPGTGEPIELGDWVHPVLVDGQAVLLLEPPTRQPCGRRRWRTAPRWLVRQY